MDHPVACNLCGADEPDVVATRDRRGRPLRTVVCRRCGLVYSNPRPAAAVVRSNYSPAYRQEDKGTKVPPRRQLVKGARGARARAGALAGILAPGMRVLDVGCGAGELVFLLRARGADAAGIEPDEGYARHARDILGLPVTTGFVQDVDQPEASFDLITLYHALEHTEDPSAIVRRLAGWLAPGAALVVEVPNIEARCEDPAHRFHFAHFYGFSPKTLAAVGRKAGLLVRSVSVSPDGGNLTAVFERRPDDGGGDWLSDLAGHAAAIRAALSNQSRAAYYLSRWPYRRLWSRLALYAGDTRTLAGHPASSSRDLLARLLTPE
jgi:2-polyprenyl-3-methyl-5-hydroxy-6-metoxy-1,4-benzoquinol methylase